MEEKKKGFLTHKRRPTELRRIVETNYNTCKVSKIYGAY
jgi:hypothetical protein